MDSFPSSTSDDDNDNDDNGDETTALHAAEAPPPPPPPSSSSFSLRCSLLTIVALAAAVSLFALVRQGKPLLVLQGETAATSSEKQKQQQQKQPPPDAHETAEAAAVNATADHTFAASLDYVRGFQPAFDVSVAVGGLLPVLPQGKSLLFLHIPKSGGTSVENVAAKSGIAWGACRFQKNVALVDGLCPRPSQYPANGMTEESDWGVGILWPRPPKLQMMEYWHTPAQYYPLSPYFDPYKNADLFVVVRNPYTRALSEYSWSKCSKYLMQRQPCNFTETPEVFDATSMNNFLQNRVGAVAIRDAGDVNAVITLEMRGHFAPQYSFVVSQPNMVRMADHVVSFERFQEEFRRLMEAYSLGDVIRLDHKYNSVPVCNTTDPSANGNNKGNNSSTQQQQQEPVRKKKLDVQDLDNKTIRVLNEVYVNDFDALGYAKNRRIRRRRIR